MGGCAAPNCSNHTRQKPSRSFYRFPKDQQRKKKWLVQTKRDQWDPKSSDRLCDAHFEPQMFTIQVSTGKRVLKETAIPTIFEHRPKPKRRPTRVKRNIIEEPAEPLSNYMSIYHEHSYARCETEANKENEKNASISLATGMLVDTFFTFHNKL